MDNTKDNIKIVMTFKDKEPKPTLEEELVGDSTLEINPKIKGKNFFEDEEVIDFLLDQVSGDTLN